MIGGILASAITAFGAEQISNVQAAQDGALVEGGIPGRDSVPFLLEPGELVVPRRNFNDVIEGEVLRRTGGAGAEGEPEEGGRPEGEIILRFDDSAIAEAVSVEIARLRNLGISVI